MIYTLIWKIKGGMTPSPASRFLSMGQVTKLSVQLGGAAVGDFRSMSWSNRTHFFDTYHHWK